MGMSISFYVERRVEGRWEWVPGPNARSREFAGIGRGRNVFAALMGDPGFAYSGEVVLPAGAPCVRHRHV